MTDADQILATLGLGTAGAAGGAALADSKLLNALYLRLLQKRGVRRGGYDPRLSIQAQAGYDLHGGSGEAVIASNQAALAQRNGIGAYYVNTQRGRPWHVIASDESLPLNVRRSAKLWDPASRIGSGAATLEKLKNIPAHLDGKPSTALDLLVDRLTKHGGLTKPQALKFISSGKLANYLPGELLDSFKTIGGARIKDFVNGKFNMMPTVYFDKQFGTPWRRATKGGHIPAILSGETGMRYTSVEELTEDAIKKLKELNQEADSKWVVRPEAVANNTDAFGRNTRNLGVLTGFDANYKTPDAPFIAGSRLYDPGVGRRNSFMRRLMYTRDRKKMLNLANQLLAKDGVPAFTQGNKVLFISTGAAGPLAAQKLQRAVQAVSDPKYKDYRIIVQYGKEPVAGATGVDLASSNGIHEVIARANKKRPGLVSGIARIDPKYYGLFARTADAHIAYGGSSSLTEVLANLNPTVFAHDVGHNRNNILNISKRSGLKSIDTTAMALKDLILNKADPNMAVGQGVKLIDATNTLRSYYGLPALDAKSWFNPAQQLDFDAIERNDIKAIREAMDAPKDWFSKKNVSRVNGVLDELTQRNKDVLGVYRSEALSGINRHDNRALCRMKPGFKRGYTRLARAFNRTAGGRRFGIPLAALGALGLGGAGYALTSKQPQPPPSTASVLKDWFKSLTKG